MTFPDDATPQARGDHRRLDERSNGRHASIRRHLDDLRPIPDDRPPLPAHPPAQHQAVLGALAPALPALRFHPALACRDDAGRRRRFSALVAAVTGPDGALEEAPGATNAHRGQETER